MYKYLHVCAVVDCVSFYQVLSGLVENLSVVLEIFTKVIKLDPKTRVWVLYVHVLCDMRWLCSFLILSATRSLRTNSAITDC